LWIEGSPNSKLLATADTAGVYRFSALQPGKYSLRLHSRGFRILTLTSIQLGDGEQKAMPTLQLELGSLADCGGHAVLKSILLMPSKEHVGNLVGSVRVDKGQIGKEGPPVAGAEARLMCATGEVCGTTKTDSQGGFRFDALAPGAYYVRVSRAGFYPLNWPGYIIQEGIESSYWSLYLERCNGTCDPRLRPKKPIATCE
jgi:hypothetical protein